MPAITTSAYEPIQLPLPVWRCGVEEYHRMTAAGVFGDEEHFELLEGWIAAPMTRNPPHDVSLVLTQEALQRLLPRNWHVRVQSAITTADSEPEPDLAVVRGGARDFIKHHPGPAETALVVEIAELSLTRDRQTKARVYARAGIQSYWIINLEERRLEVYSEPTGPCGEPSYLRHRDYSATETAPFTLPGSVEATIPVNELLP